MDIIFNNAKYLMFTQQLNLVTSDLRAILVTPDFTPLPTMVFVDDGVAASPINFEVDGTGYVPGNGGTGRHILENKSYELDQDVGTWFVTDDLQWTGLNVGLVGGVILYKNTDDDATSILIGYSTSGGFPKNTDGGQLDIRWDEDIGVIFIPFPTTA